MPGEYVAYRPCGARRLRRAYLLILAEGVLEPGDQVDITHRPSHGVTIGLVAEWIREHPNR